MHPETTPPISVALIDDYEIVLTGLAHMFDHYRDRVVVAEIDMNVELSETVDVVLYDSFAQPIVDHGQLARLVENPHARKVVVYGWSSQPDAIEDALQQGVSGYLSKNLPARDLVAAIEAVHAGQIVISEIPRRAGSTAVLNWPGRQEGISDRESEILALITQGKSNADIAAMMYLSPNTVKSHIRSVYSKIGVASRTQAVLWGIAHGFSPDQRRIDHWAPRH